MTAPKNREELEQTTFFKAGADARKRRIPLGKAIACLRPDSWQYDAFIEGYDAKPQTGQHFGTTN